MERTAARYMAGWAVVSAICLGGGLLGVHLSSPVAPSNPPAATPLPVSASVAPLYTGAEVLQENGRAVSCTDWSTSAADIARRFNKATLTGSIPIKPACAAAFPGRQVFASCSIRVGELAMAEFHYDFARAFEDDDLHLRCLEHGGRWEQVAEDSREYRQAQAKAASKERRARAAELFRRLDEMQEF